MATAKQLTEYTVRSYLKLALKAMRLAKDTFNKELYANAKGQFREFYKRRHTLLTITR